MAIYDAGDLIFDGFGGEGQVPCDGSQYPVEAYPELGEVMSQSNVDQAGVAPGYFRVPDIPDQRIGNTVTPVYIQLEA